VFAYRIAGLSIGSEVAIEDCPAADDSVAAPDVTIRLCADTGEPAAASFRTAWAAAAKHDFVFRPQPGLSFRVRDGREISIARDAGVSPADVRAYLMGSAFGVLWHQRGLMPLHCSAIAFGGSAFAFTGASGAGKSTLAAGLSLRGLAHVCDDVGVVDPGVAEWPIWPMPKDVKLWRDAAAMLGLSCGAPVATRVAKFYVAPPRLAGGAPLRLSALYVLHHSSEPCPQIVPLHGSTQFRALLASIYRSEWMGLVREPAELFRQVATLGQRLRLFRFSRPRDLGRFADCAAFLEAHMADIVAKEASL
jgi:hypothetical protein